MLLDKVLEVLRNDKPRRKRAKIVVAVHVFGECDCAVQVGNRVVLQGVTRARAVEEIRAQVERFKTRGLPHAVEVFEEKK